MRSIYIYIKENKSSEVASYLDSICTSRKAHNETWLYEYNNDQFLYIEFYEKKYWDEIHKKDLEKLISKLGTEPKLSLCIDVSGRHPGKEELFSFLKLFLKKYDGVVLDDYTNFAWKLNEILDGKLIEGHPFFDYKGWYEENKK